MCIILLLYQYVAPSKNFLWPDFFVEAYENWSYERKLLSIYAFSADQKERKPCVETK
jgi:hypothetical protein